MQIADGCVASFHYTLTNDSGETLDSSSGHDPLSYLQGSGNIVRGLEKAMAGKQVGDKFTVDVIPSEGYGEHNPALIQEVPAQLVWRGQADPAWHAVPRGRRQWSDGRDGHQGHQQERHGRR